METPKFVVLAVLDGWGLASPGAGNAISQSQTVNMNRFWASYPHGRLAAAGEAVGLPQGESGNTETGHINLGAGRVVYQDLARINLAIADGTFYTDKAFLGAIEHAKKNSSNLHLMGLVGSQGVHSSINHLIALIELAKKNDFSRVFIHIFTDGRDSPPTSAKTYIARLREIISKEGGVGTIASVMGRYWAMDRDLRWDRTKKAYMALTQGVGHLVKTPEEAIDASYLQGITDEFIDPAVISGPDGKPVALIKENDSVIFYNFRIDRPKQLSKAFVMKDFTLANTSEGFDPYLVKYEKKHISQENRQVQSPFDRGEAIKNLHFVTMTEYTKVLAENGAEVAFPPQNVVMPLGSVIASLGKKQLRVSESEKERFVTYYFNGLVETPFAGEDRLIIPSPKVPTYDQKPEMSAREMTEALLSHLKSDVPYELILINYANVDMVGHTGNIGAAVNACNVVDECIGKLANFTLAYGGALVITGDHGNAEEMIDAATGKVQTEHSGNNVPFIVIQNDLLGNSVELPFGTLADVAPTILSLLKLEIPGQMTGQNLLSGLT